jgi:hypothetical protein
MIKKTKYNGKVSRAYKFICDWVESDPEFAKQNCIFLRREQDRTDWEINSTDRIIVRFSPTIASWEHACWGVSVGLQILIEISVPSYLSSDGLDLWEVLNGALLEATLEEVSSCSQYGIGEMVDVRPAIAYGPATSSLGSVTISVGYDHQSRRET